MQISLTSTNSLNVLPLLDSISSTFNPYPLILKSINDQKKKLANPHILIFAATVISTHFILLIQAAITFLLKAFRKKNGNQGGFWLWRRKYIPNHDLPYFVPNGKLFCELLQLIGCLCFEWFAISTYISCRKPALLSAGMRASSFFGLAVSFAPGFIGFWLSGWSAIYVVFFSPSRPNTKHIGRSSLQRPLLMNAICIGIPLLITLFFVSAGIAFSFKHHQLSDSFQMLTTTLDQFSNLWKPNDSNNPQNNQTLLEIMSTIQKHANELGKIGQLMAFGWASVSLLIIMFYLATTLTLGKSMKRAMLSISGTRSSYYGKGSDYADTKNILSQSTRTENSQATSEISGNPLSNQEFALSLQRSYYFAFISCGIIILALGFNFTSSLILGLKTKVFLIQTQWQTRIFALLTCTSVLLSVSLFLQSLLLILS